MGTLSSDHMVTMPVPYISCYRCCDDQSNITCCRCVRRSTMDVYIQTLGLLFHKHLCYVSKPWSCFCMIDDWLIDVAPFCHCPWMLVENGACISNTMYDLRVKCFFFPRKKQFSDWFQRNVSWSVQVATCKTAMETSFVSVWCHMTVLHSRAVTRIALMVSGSAKRAAKFANARSVVLWQIATRTACMDCVPTTEAVQFANVKVGTTCFNNPLPFIRRSYDVMSPKHVCVCP